MDQQQLQDSLDEEYSQETYMDDEYMINQSEQGGISQKQDFAKGVVKNTSFQRPATIRKSPREYVVHDELKKLLQEQDTFNAVNVIPPEILQPFIPEFIPAVGGIDSCLKVPRPDGKQEDLGLKELDEPPIKQSNPSVLNLQLAQMSKHSMTNIDSPCGQITHDDPYFEIKIDDWISNIQNLSHHQAGSKNQLNLPNALDFTFFNQDWSPEFKSILNQQYYLDDSVGKTARNECQLLKHNIEDEKANN